MSNSIRNAGHLRAFLLDTMSEVRAGTLKVEQASVIQKLAAQVNENLYAEAKVSKLQKDAGFAVPELGELPLRSHF